MNKWRSSAVWLGELICGALGTALWMLILARLKFGPDHAQSDYPHGLVGVVVGMSAMVLIEFAITGYALTTILASLFTPRRSWFLYPVVCAVLYLVHSEIFFLAVGNRMFETRYLIDIQLGGACLTFLVCCAGEWLRGSRPPQARAA